MTPTDLIAALHSGTATNDDIARSRGWRVYNDRFLFPPGSVLVAIPCPDYLNDIRLTLADIEAKGWGLSLMGPLLPSGEWQVCINAGQNSREAIAPTLVTALLIAFAGAQQAGGG